MGVALGQCPLRLAGAQAACLLRYLGGHTHAGLVPQCLRAGQALVGRGLGGGVGAEQVDLPTCLHPRLGGGGEGCQLLVDTPAGLGLAVERGAQRRTAGHLAGTGLGHARLRLCEPWADGLRRSDQFDQQRVVQAGPPLRQGLEGSLVRQRGLPGSGGL